MNIEYEYLVIMAAGIAGYLFVHKREKEKEFRKKRATQMTIDYPEIVSKFLVYFGAGLSIRMIWEKLAQTGPQGRYAYDEIRKAAARLSTGAVENEVYRDFGRNCGLSIYMKFAGLLEQSRRNGSAGLEMMLTVEMQNAWQSRKDLAIRQGEEASTRLLIPLVMMLGIVMVMVMYPAMTSMNL